MAVIIPFSPFPFRTLRGFARPFMRFGARLEKAFPYLKLQLQQAGFEIDVKEYIGIMVALTLFYFVIFAIVFPIVLRNFVPQHFLLLGLTLAAVMAFLVFIQISIYPLLQVRKKIRQIEVNLIFALRTIMVEIKSGVSLFGALNMVAKGKYGALSNEFKKTIDEINTGTPQETALQHLATNNPSPFLRKSLWQIVNGMKAGADITDIVAETVSSMNREQKLSITRFGSQLRVLSLMYMMIGVIIPAMGLAIFVVFLTIFPPITKLFTENQTLVSITGMFQRILPDLQPVHMVFWLALILLALVQFMYVGMIKSRRPTLLGD